ncbi:MAG: sucrase ferredoxin, partial [Catenulispora sp.]|nr:sucrase ferredoxin [Catenulispora sp.]
MRDDQLPAPQPHACAVLSRELGEPVAGTAATQSAWLLLEQPGPWGRVAARESRLDSELGAELEGRTAGTGVRLCLIRRPEDGRHEHEPARRRWFAASTHPAHTWLATGEVTHPTELLKIDFARLDAGDRRAVAELEHTFLSTPIMGICTNGKRDACCATLGRRVVVAAEALDAAACPATDGPPAIWEITHLGGHKFSPTGVLLPSGYLYGRLDAALATRVLAEARRDRVTAAGCRGRSTWARP